MQGELAVRSENIQAMYGFFLQEKLQVNRRYQRKLVWSLEEKRAFIDSILQGFPVPILLFAETKRNNKDVYEIIDGMQRLNAIMSFIENEFDIDGKFFDLNTMVETKELFDKGTLEQRTPALERVKSSIVARYVLPLSIYSFDTESKVDEIFRRINSNGKHLSNQELRSAGATSKFANLVRKTAEVIRGDTSQSDIVPLSKMKLISIDNKGLSYGIESNSIYWVKRGIINKERLRDSKDEEIIANSFVYMALSEAQRTSSHILDELYGFSGNGNRLADLESALKSIDTDELKTQYIKTHDVLNELLQDMDTSFNQCVVDGTNKSVPRYYEVVFCAFYDLLYKKNMEIQDREKLKKLFKNIGGNISITTGGIWDAMNKQKNINAVIGVLENCFKKRNQNDPANSQWITEFQSLLTQSIVEQTLYDFKQGFNRLYGAYDFDEHNFDKIIKTLTAMANDRPLSSGYVCIGVADNLEDAKKIKELHGVTYEIVNGFYITGINHEIKSDNITPELWLKKVIGRIEKQPISENFKLNLNKNIRLISFKGRQVLILSIKNLGEPAIYKEKYYQRSGPQVIEIPPANYPQFFTSFSMFK